VVEDSISFFCDITPHYWVLGSRRFERTQCFHLQRSDAVFPNHRQRFRDKSKNIYINSEFLRARRSGDQIPMGARFSAPVQTGPGAHPASCTMGTGSFIGGKAHDRDSSVYGQVAGSCECGNEPSGSIKRGEFFD
jgi:hypothetical protein